MKEISMHTLNKIKALDEKIFEYLDDDYPNNRGVAICERAIARRLEADGIVDDSLKEEARTLIRWHNDDCKSALERAGWKIILGPKLKPLKADNL